MTTPGWWQVELYMKRLIVMMILQTKNQSIMNEAASHVTDLLSVTESVVSDENGYDFLFDPSDKHEAGCSSNLRDEIDDPQGAWNKTHPEMMFLDSPADTSGKSSS
ncbi:hypothetical protein GN958_ATG10301 [Phytophthora infestans]|uniref:Uncharacterized protein n=1 Tax=Phytophthora infestans TaxID=4787 RepID=A0A8S9UCY2_PHYIN|nr:hypothetical protein GN958_ATG12443 [Phytophthora infestans]KAF4138364.1 hypothetical protein GN958_ATG12444 [Phytophthora infestans]KAF4140505.1 hypothetical protein GN958_ATG10301 [Phytophthora infestans]